jgi:hypothetical protein
VKWIIVTAFAVLATLAPTPGRAASTTGRSTYIDPDGRRVMLDNACLYSLLPTSPSGPSDRRSIY